MSPPSTSSPEDFLASFPESPTKIDGQPTYTSLTQLRNVLKRNGASVPCINGGGAHGYLGIVVSAILYDTIAPNTPFVIPAQPPVQPDLQGATTSAQIAERRTRWEQHVHSHQEYNNISNALKKQITTAIDAQYLRAIRDRHVGFANKTVQAILDFLFQSYGRITPQQLIENQKTMMSPWDPNTPFEQLIDQLEDGSEFADAGSQPITDSQILTMAYTLVHQTGMYFQELKDWRAKPVEQHSWTNFKTHMLEAQIELRLQQQATSGRQGYSNFSHHWNKENDENTNTAQVLADFAATTISENRATLNAFAATNENLQDKLTTALREIANLKQAIQGLKPTTKRPPNRPKNDNYCWTHGYRVANTHTSATCKQPAAGHKPEATRGNTMGGSDANKPT
jgi:uncharacterized phage-associated protein